MTPKEYGDDYSGHLLEQYKLYAEMADRVSQRRDQSNRFYAGLLAGMIAIMIVLTRLDVSDDILAVVLLVGGLFGAFLSVVWFVNIRSYRTLNTAKYKVINELEESLPTRGYAREWDLLTASSSSPRYFQLTRVEQFVPVIMFLLFSGLVTYSILRLCLGG